MERTFVMIKPDGVRRKLIGEIVSRFELRNLAISEMKMLRPDRELAKKHYIAHADKDFYVPLVDFMMSGTVVAMVVEGENAIGLVRKMMGALNPIEAIPGTIRGDLTTSVRENLVHSSDSLESAEYEIGLWFPCQSNLSHI